MTSLIDAGQMNYGVYCITTMRLIAQGLAIQIEPMERVFVSILRYRNLADWQPHRYVDAGLQKMRNPTWRLSANDSIEEVSPISNSVRKLVMCPELYVSVSPRKNEFISYRWARRAGFEALDGSKPLTRMPNLLAPRCSRGIISCQLPAAGEILRHPCSRCKL